MDLQSVRMPGSLGDSPNIFIEVDHERTLVLLVLIETLSAGFFCVEVAAQSGQVTGGTIQCQSPQTNDFDVSWSGTWTLPPWSNYQVVGVYKPVYTWSSPPTYYSPGAGMGAPPPTTNPGSSDGSETVAIPQTMPGNITLKGVYVYFEYGYWINNGGFFYWSPSGVLCTAWWLPHPGGACFSAGTHVLTPAGSTPIELLRAGDAILTSNRNSLQEPLVNRVKRVTISHSTLLDLNVNGKTISTTPEHAFYTLQKGWTRAGSIVAGDYLQSHDRKWIPVTSVSEGPQSKVFNLIVDGKSSFYVGRREWGFSAQVADGCSGIQSSSFPKNQVHSGKNRASIDLGELFRKKTPDLISLDK